MFFVFVVVLAAFSFSAAAAASVAVVSFKKMENVSGMSTHFFTKIPILSCRHSPHFLFSLLLFLCEFTFQTPPRHPPTPHPTPTHPPTLLHLFQSTLVLQLASRLPFTCLVNSCSFSLLLFSSNMDEHFHRRVNTQKANGIRTWIHRSTFLSLTSGPPCRLSRSVCCGRVIMEN